MEKSWKSNDGENEILSLLSCLYFVIALRGVSCIECVELPVARRTTAMDNNGFYLHFCRSSDDRISRWKGNKFHCSAHTRFEYHGKGNFISIKNENANIWIGIDASTSTYFGHFGMIPAEIVRNKYDSWLSKWDYWNLITNKLSVRQLYFELKT